MKRFLWMVLIFTFLFSLTALFAQQTATAAKQVEKDEVAIEKVGKKVSEVPKVHIRQNSEKNAQSKSNVSSNDKKVQKNAAKKVAEPVKNKRPKALPIDANKSE